LAARIERLKAPTQLANVIMNCRERPLDDPKGAGPIGLLTAPGAGNNFILHLVFLYCGRQSRNAAARSCCPNGEIYAYKLGPQAVMPFPPWRR
jgi:hypothetical protein